MGVAKLVSDQRKPPIYGALALFQPEGGFFVAPSLRLPSHSVARANPVDLLHSGVSSHDLAHYLAHQSMKKGSTKEPEISAYAVVCSCSSA